MSHRHNYGDKVDDLKTFSVSNFIFSPLEWNKDYRNLSPHCALFEKQGTQLLINAISLSEKVEILTLPHGFIFKMNINGFKYFLLFCLCQ